MKRHSSHTDSSSRTHGNVRTSDPCLISRSMMSHLITPTCRASCVDAGHFADIPTMTSDNVILEAAWLDGYGFNPSHTWHGEYICPVPDQHLHDAQQRFVGGLAL